MKNPPLVKICGLRDEEAVCAAFNAGADFLGFVFVPDTPRFVVPEHVSALLAAMPPDALDAVAITGLFVDPSDAELDAVFRHLRLDAVQLHGSETPARVEAVRSEYAVEVIKAVAVETEADLALAEPYRDCADHLLFDAKPPPGAKRPGGNGRSFPWSVLRSWRGEGSWFVAGGLTPDNVARALRESGAPGVDVSSGVESALGVKDPEKIAAFIRAVDETDRDPHAA